MRSGAHAGSSPTQPPFFPKLTSVRRRCRLRSRRAFSGAPRDLPLPKRTRHAVGIEFLDAFLRASGPSPGRAPRDSARSVSTHYNKAHIRTAFTTISLMTGGHMRMSND